MARPRSSTTASIRSRRPAASAARSTFRLASSSCRLSSACSGAASASEAPLGGRRSIVRLGGDSVIGAGRSRRASGSTEDPRSRIPLLNADASVCFRSSNLCLSTALIAKSTMKSTKSSVIMSA
jgi:hypothetical protein